MKLPVHSPEYTKVQKLYEHFARVSLLFAECSFHRLCNVWMELKLTLLDLWAWANGYFLWLHVFPGASASLQYSDHTDWEGESGIGGERREGEAAEEEGTKDQGLCVMWICCPSTKWYVIRFIKYEIGHPKCGSKPCCWYQQPCGLSVDIPWKCIFVKSSGSP